MYPLPLGVSVSVVLRNEGDLMTPNPYESPAAVEAKRNRIREVIRSAVAIVNTWPLWKQNILENSASPTVRVPRLPVIVEEQCSS